MCFFVKQKTENAVHISDWSSDVCSSDRAWRGVDRRQRPPAEFREEYFMKRLCLVSAAALIAVVFSGVFGTAPAAAETAAEFYQCKVVKLVVGYGPGGGYDLYARLLADRKSTRLNSSH